MNYRCLCFVAGIAALVSLAQGQNVKSNWTAPRTPDGHPDFQGFWENNIATPLQRPEEIANRPTLTNAEVEKMRQKSKELFTAKSDAVFFDEFGRITAPSGMTSEPGKTGHR